MKFLYSILLLFIFSTYHFSAASAEYRYWSAFDQSRRDTFIDFGLNTDVSVSGDALRFNSNNEAEYGGSLIDRRYSDTLVAYYRHARANDINPIKNLYFSGDGSLERYKKEIQEIPDMFSAFHRLRRIEFTDTISWGNYVAVRMKWFGREGLITPWVELFYCDKEDCLISNRLFHQNKEFSFFSALLHLMRVENELSDGKGSSGMWFDAVFSEDAVEDPVQLGFKFGFFNKKIVLERRDTEDYASLSNISASGDIKKSVDNIADFVTNVWALDSTSDLSVNSDRESQNDKMKKINALYTESWGEDYSRQLIQNYNFFRDGEAGNSNKSYLERFDGVKNFTNYALTQKIARWQSLHPVAYAVDEKALYVWLGVLVDGGQREYAVFLVDLESGDLTTPNRVASGKLISSSVFAKYTIKYLANRDSQ